MIRLRLAENTKENPEKYKRREEGLLNVLKYDRKLGVEVLDIIWPRRNYINVTDDWRRKRDWAGCLRLETRDKDRNTITNTNTKAKTTNKTNTKQKTNTKTQQQRNRQITSNQY